MLFLVLPPAAFHLVYRDSLPIFYKFGDSPTGRVLFLGIATCQNCMYQIIQSSNMHVLDGLTRHHGIKNDAVKRVNLILTVSITVIEHLQVFTRLHKQFTVDFVGVVAEQQNGGESFTSRQFHQVANL